MSNKTFVTTHAQHIRANQPCTSRKGYATSHAHIYCEGDHLESYGSHYPLLYAIESKSSRRLLVVNRQGYSSSTSKHIAYASFESDIWVYDSRVKHIASAVLEHLETVRQGRQSTYDALKRKDTQKAAWMLVDIATIQKHIDMIND